MCIATSAHSVKVVATCRECSRSFKTTEKAHHHADRHAGHTVFVIEERSFTIKGIQ